MEHLNVCRLFVHILVIFCCLAIFSDIAVEARGGGGRGGGRGGRGGRGRGSSARARTASSSRVWRRSGMKWKTAGTAGYLYGYNNYRVRRRYINNPEEPVICSNYHDYLMSNGTIYKYFICPKVNDPEKLHYCCGPEGKQVCCGFWDSGGRVAGVVIGIILAVGLLSCAVCGCCFGKPKQDYELQAWTDARFGSVTVPLKPMPPEDPIYKGPLPDTDPDKPTEIVPPPGASEYPAAPNGVAPAYLIDDGGMTYPPNEPAPYPPTEPAYPPESTAPHPSEGPGYPMTDYPPAGSEVPPGVAPPPYPGAPNL